MLSAATHLNWTAVTAAFAAYFVLGALWFLLLFPKTYRRSLGLPDSAPAGNPALFVAGPAACTLVVVLTSAVLMKALAIATYGDAVLFGLLTGVGYIVATTVNTAINPVFKRPFFYSLVSGGYHLAGMLLASVVLVAAA